MLAFLVVAALFATGRAAPSAVSSAAPSAVSSAAPAPPAPAAQDVTRPSAAVAVPARAFETLRLIDAGDWPDAAHAPGTKGGDRFRNSEGQLPRSTTAGIVITYREWDVNPKQPHRTRDAERIVTGSDGSAWYTSDHYRTFSRMR